MPSSVRIGVTYGAFRCKACGATGGTSREMTVVGFQRALRAFERNHNGCLLAKSVMDARAVIARMRSGSA